MTAAPASAARARLRLLDGFEFESDGQRVELPVSTQRVVAFLAFHERPLLRTYVAGCLWTDKSSERSYANLRSALWRLRRPAAQLIECRDAHLSLAADVDVDLRRVMDVARSRLDGTDDASLDGDSVLLSGDLLPDWYDDWVVVERERLRQLRLHALEALCRNLTDAGRFGEAVDVGMAAVAAEPLRESAHHALVRAHLREGNTADAAREYVRYRDLVRGELGIEPSPRLTALLAEVIDLGVIDSWTRRTGLGRESVLEPADVLGVRRRDRPGEP
jgi:DNA-binding SARP family transcriptional activator